MDIYGHQREWLAAQTKRSIKLLPLPLSVSFYVDAVLVNAGAIAFMESGARC